MIMRRCTVDFCTAFLRIKVFRKILIILRGNGERTFAT